jgi:hypothetical protein
MFIVQATGAASERHDDIFSDAILAIDAAAEHRPVATSHAGKFQK